MLTLLTPKFKTDHIRVPNTTVTGYHLP